MSESFDTPPTAAETQAAGFDTPPTAAEQGFDSPPTSEETPLNVGVMPMPSRAEHLAALRAAPTEQDTAPGAYTLGGPSASAFQATSRGLTGQQAGEALQLSKATGFSPDFAADNAADLRTQTDRAAMTQGLARSPVLAGYAAQSSVHAAAVKESVGPLQALEQGLMDLGYQVAAEKEFMFPGTEDVGLGMSEGETAAYERKDSPWYADLLRSAPTLATYYLFGFGGKMLGGKAGEFTTTAGAMFMLNRGTLYRQIMREMPIPASDEEGIIGQGIYDQDAYEQRARTYATAGAGASAALGAGLSTAIGMMFPGAAPRAASLANGLIARAFTDAATRDIVQRLAQAGGHTLSGALMMAIPAVVDDATVQEAVRGHVDPGKAAVAGWEAFKKSLLAAGALSALPHILPIARDIGRINRAGEDAARLQSHVDQASQANLPPDEKREVIGRMVAQSDVPAVHVDPEHLSPEATQKLVETLADDGQSLAEAKALGVEVPVPTEKYLTDLADQHETIKQDVKLDPEGLTPRQAEGAKEDLAARTALDAAFKDAKTGNIINTGPTHDYHRLPGGEIGLATIGPEDWIDGFVDRKTGEFLTRDEAAKRVYGSTDQGPLYSEHLLSAEDVARDLYEDAPRPVFDEEGNRIEAPKKSAGAAPTPAITGEQIGQLRRALESKAPEPAPIPAPELEDHAAQAVEAKTIGELQPGRYERAAQAASDRIARSAAQQATGHAAGVKQPGEGAALGRVVKLSDLTQARDLARAMAKKVGEVRAEMDGIRDRITDRFDDDKVRAYLNLADPAYRAATDSILGQLGLAPEVLGAQGVDGAVARMSNDARLLGFDADAIKDIFDRGRDWKSLTPAEARNVQDALTSIREAAKAETEIALIDRKMNLREMVSLVGQHLFGGRPGGPPPRELPAPGAGEPESKATTAGRLIGEALQPREILRRLGPMGDAVYDLFVRSRNYKEELSRKVGAILNEAWSELPADLRKRRNEVVAGPGSPVVNDNAWTRQDLWMLAAWYGSESGAERLRNGLQITDEQILHAISQLSPAEAQFIDKMHALNDEHLWPLVQEHETRNTGTSAPKIQARPFTVTLADGEAHTFRGGYWPAKDAGPADPPPAETVADYWGTVRNGFPATSKSFTKERAASASYRPDLRWQSYGNHLNTVLHYLAFDDFVREGGRLVRDKEFRDIVEQGLGPQAPTELDKFVQVAARGNVEAAKGGAEWWNRIVGGGARSLVATSAFRLNFPVVLGQFSHIPAAKAGLGLTWFDMAQGVGKTFMPSTWADAHARSEQLPYRWNGYGGHLREMIHNVGPEGERSGILRGLDIASSLPYHLMDGFLSHAIWRSMEARAERLGLARPEIDRMADRAVAVMMPPLNLAEQSSVARDRGLIGSLLLVRNFPNTLFNVGAMRAWDARNAILSAEPGWQRAVAKVGAPTMAAASYLGTVWAAHIVGRFLMGHGRREDETTPQWLERDAIAAPFYPVPVLSEFGEPLATAITSKQSFGQAFLRSEADIQSAPMLAFMQGLVRNIGQAASSGRGSEDRVFAGLRTAATLFGTGAWPLKPARYTFDLQTGKARPRGPFDVAGGLFYGQHPKQERNPFTVIQDIESGRFR